MVNSIKVEKDHDDVNVIVSFSGRREWNTFLNVLHLIYRDSDFFLEDNPDLFKSENELRELYKSVTDLIGEIKTCDII